MLARTEEAIESRLSSELDHATTLLEVHQLDAAEVALKRAERLAPGDGRVSALRGRLRAARTPAPAVAGAVEDGPPDAAPPTPRILAPDEQREVAAFYQRGLGAIDEGRVDDAIRYWTFVWTTAPDHGQVRELLTREHVSRGMESFASGRYESAIADWETALQITPQDQRVVGYLERARRQQERLRQIVDDTRKTN
jgi:tetratricopeptide (TPR) repeat protein